MGKDTNATTPSVMFMNAATGWLLQVDRSKATPDPAIVFGPGGGYQEEWWRFVRPDGMSFTPAWHIQNAATGTALTVLDRVGVNYGVRLRPIAEQLDPAQLWYIEHYPNSFYDPWTMPVLPNGIRLWCKPEPELGLVLAPLIRLEPHTRFPSAPIILGCLDNSQAGGESHWFPSQLPGQ